VSRKWPSPPLLALVLGCGCGESPPPAPKAAPLETVEVAPPADAGLTVERDTQERRPVAAIAGILPAGFPADFPLPEPGSLVDFGEAEAGWRYVVVQTPQPPPAVRAALGARLARTGWTAVAGAEATYQKGGRAVRLAFADARPGTRVRLEYPAAPA
jgi:hypothetical protein